MRTGGGTAATMLPFVVPLPVALVVDPAAAELEPGATRQFRALLTYSDGVQLDVTATAQWSSDDSSVAAISATGLATAVSSGTTAIRARVAVLEGSATVNVSSTGPLPPDPVTVAPSFEPGTAPSFDEAVSFLYSGSAPIQEGVAPGTIEVMRVSVIRGRVLTRTGQPLSGVTVTISGHPELGQTTSRADGAFDLAVNGGGELQVRYDRAGFLSAERAVVAPWRDFTTAPDVVLLPVDPNVTTIVPDADVTQVARGSVVTDDDGSRRATLLFVPGTTATMTVADGTPQPLSSMSVRATEYTVGPNGPRSMPAALPPTSGYTYAVELTVDEALAAGATRVEFSRPVAFYVENFLGFPTGTGVPLAWYDRARHAWIPAADGRVIRIVTIESGVAHVDTDGDGTADDAGLDAGERQQLASLYAAGTALWRVAIQHFTPWDLNWSVGLPPGAAAPNGQPTYFAPHDDPSCTGGSVIECENQTLGEVVPVTGTGISLHYRSDRTPGRVASRTIDVHAIGDEVPPNLLRADVEISIAGQQVRRMFPPEPGQTWRFTWDGRDAYGRTLPGGARVIVRTTYVYEGEFQSPVPVERSFGLASGEGTGVASRIEVGLPQVWEGVLGAWSASSLRLGGWTLSPHHFYDAATKTLYRGDGSRRTAVPQVFGTPDGVLETLAGRAGVHDHTWSDAGGPARSARITEVSAAAVAPDGTLYMAAWDFLMKITPAGQLLQVAGKLPSSFPSDAHVTQPASTAQLYTARDVAVGPDGTIYIAEGFLNRVRKITADGMISPFAGNGEATGTPAEEGVVATDAPLMHPSDVAVGPDGSIYIAEADAYRVRRVNADGRMYTVAGSGIAGFRGDGGPATAAWLDTVAAIAIGSDGTLYIADDGSRIRAVTPDGIITTIAGTGASASTGDGGPATDAAIDIGMRDSTYLAVGPDGSIYFSEWSRRIRRIDPAGIINTIVGNGARLRVSPDGTRGMAANLEFANSLTVGPDGALHYHDWWAVQQRRISPALPISGGGEIRIADGDVVHVFTSSGRHLRTLHVETGGELSRFVYTAGLLTSIVDADGNVIEIERSGGEPVAIVAPGGQRTSLAGTPWLSSITTAPGEMVSFDYTPLGLMTSRTDARRNETTFDWNDLGLLSRDAGPENSAKDLVRTETADGHRVEVTTAGGRTTDYASAQSRTADASRRTVSPSNLVLMREERKDGLFTTVSPDGMKLEMRETPDPAWSAQTPYVSTATVTWPSGRTLSTIAEREVVLDDPRDPTTLATVTDRVAVNAKTTTRVFERSALRETITLPSGLTAERLLDHAGRTRRMPHPAFLPVDLNYDATGRLSTVVQGGRTQTFGYDTRNEVTSVEDASGRIVRFEYDDAGRVTKQILPDLREITFTYDANGNLTSISPPGRSAHTFVYSGVNLPTRYTPPAAGSGGEVEYVYNADRQLEQIGRADGTILLGYDAGGRLQSLTARGLTLEYGYDEGGNLVSLDGQDASLAYTYDGMSPTAMSWSGAVSGTVTWTYDEEGRTLTEHAAGEPVEFYYDDDGRLTGAGEIYLDYFNGLLETVGGIRSLSKWYVRNQYGEVELTTHIVPVPPDFQAPRLTELRYTRDDAGRIIGVTETTGSHDHVLGYHYDAAGRLDEVTYPEGLVRYTYDDNGNRVSRQVITDSGTEIETASYDDQDRLLNYEGTQYTYTTGGDLLTKTEGIATTTYDYDLSGNLRTVTLPGGAVIEYLVDAQNRRVGRKVNGTVTHTWLYADQIRIIAETDHTRGLTKRFVYGSRMNVPDYMIVNGTNYVIFSDHLGSPREIVDGSTFQTVHVLRHDEFGNVLADTNQGFIPFGFAGGLYDPATKLVRFGARDYDPRTGRWTTKDAIGFAGTGVNVYTYVAADPVNFYDPLGRDAVTSDPTVRQYFYDLWRSSNYGRSPNERSAWITQHRDLNDMSTVKYGCARWPWSATYAQEKWDRDYRPLGYIGIAHTHPGAKSPKPSTGGTRDNPADDYASKQINGPVYTISRKGIWKIDPTGVISQEEGPNWHKGIKEKECLPCE